MKKLLAPQKVEAELRQLLNEASSGRPRAISATIIQIDGGQAFESGHTLPALLNGLRPVRLITAIPHSPEEGITADTRCSIDRQSRGVCIEDIIIRTKDIEAVDPALWGPFVIRDLPAILFWKRSFAELMTYRTDILHRVDIILIDGDILLNTAASYTGLAHQLIQAGSANNLPLRDLAWERIQGMRLSLCQAIKEIEQGETESPGQAARPDLVINYNIPSPWASTLFAAWLKERLAKAAQPHTIRQEQELPLWSLSIEYLGQSRELIAQMPNEKSIFTKLIDRAEIDNFWSQALEHI